MGTGILSNLEQRPKKVVNDFCKVFYKLVTFVNIIEPGDLNEPSNIVRVYVVIDSPFRQFIPFRSRTAIDWNPEFQVLVFGLLQITHDLLDDSPKEFASNIIVCLHKDFSKPGFSDGVVLCVELVKAMKSVSILELEVKMSFFKLCVFWLGGSFLRQTCIFHSTLKYKSFCLVLDQDSFISKVVTLFRVRIQVSNQAVSIFHGFSDMKNK